MINEFFKKIGNSPSAHTCEKLLHCGSRASSIGLAEKLPVSRSDELSRKNTGSRTMIALITSTPLKKVPVKILLIITPPRACALNSSRRQHQRRQ